ncbi:MAG: hypothetical protein KDI73_10070 [Candidatus Competibacteraceae bacterium]|nr:hypothetical protein [Candidatus Competibacteraceae bacterium]
MHFATPELLEQARQDAPLALFRPLAQDPLNAAMRRPHHKNGQPVRLQVDQIVL